ncbi:MAG TPA: glycine--tRNA ligase subunit beta [Candidatus Angelobacter sp.]|nr:glycine--tRNA ligase subunit beta [Candidatus Angelobacter sp.]
MPDFLLEIGIEEIPARMIDDARSELVRRMAALLGRESLMKATEGKPVQDESSWTAFASYSTPRRLAFRVSDIPTHQPDVTEQVLGPSLKVAFKDGKPTPAAEAFAKKVGVEVAKLERVTNPKGEYLAATVTRKGRQAAEILAEAVPKEIAAIYWPKSMYWRPGKPERFVRPVRWLVAILGDQVVPMEFGGAKAGKQTYGHRILSSSAPQISQPKEYEATLASAHVVVDSREREYRIRKALDAATRTIPGARWREDAELLKTVVNLTEWPAAILGSFDQQYLSLPEEVLVTVMRDHQKYFAVEDANGKLAPHFLAVLNTDGDPDGLIRHGNERVLRARFNDARFFWDTDQKTPLVNRVEMLKAVTFQKDLGSYAEKAERVGKLAGHLCAVLNKSGLKVDSNAVQQAAQLAKTDLTAELVKEFTELQGIIGGLYAKAQGLPRAVADAIYDQYKPESTEDSPPRTLEGAVLSIADKADSIAGMFALGLVPSGSKDPFALRRQANGIVKIISEHKLPIDIGNMVNAAAGGFEGTEAQSKFKPPSQITIGSRKTGEKINVPEHPGAIVHEIYQFFRERIDFYLRESLGFTYDTVNAVLEISYSDIVDVVKRCEAISQIRSSADFMPLFIAFKRTKNIIRQAKEKGYAIPWLPPESEFSSKEETALWSELRRLQSSYLPLKQEHKYLEAFRELAKVKEPVDEFFDSVMVMVEDPTVRARRLGLLNYFFDEFNTIADLSALAPEVK